MQELLVAALRHEHPGLHDNRGAGIEALLRRVDVDLLEGGEAESKALVQERAGG